MYTTERLPLSNRWEDRLPAGYDFVIIGSGYGGAITAARLANARWPDRKPSICILERGREWLPGQFPDNLRAGAGALRSALNPLGLYDFRIGADIGAWMGSGLGGTSLINANVAIEPDNEVFDNPQWPQAIRDARDSGALKSFFARVRSTLNAGRHPRGSDLSKVRALQLGVQGNPEADFDLCDIAVNFEFEGEMAPDVALNYGMQKRFYPFTRLSGPANILVMPGLQSASLSAKLLRELGGESVLGPYMLGLEHPVQIAPMTASASDLVMLAVLAGGDAHARQQRQAARSAKSARRN